MAELTGRRGGYSHGKGGSMHMFSREKNFLRRPRHRRRPGADRHRPRLRPPLPRRRQDLASPISATARSTRARSTKASTWPSLWKLPVVYVIENNRYGMGTSIDRASARTDLYHRGEAYGIPGEQVDGMDVVAVHEAGLAAAEHARRGEGPIILEMHDLPLSRPLDVRSGQVPHQGGGRQDAHRARSDRAVCGSACSTRRRRRGRAQGRSTSEVRDIVAEAAQFAQDSPEPDPTELWTDVLAEA